VSGFGLWMLVAVAVPIAAGLVFRVPEMVSAAAILGVTVLGVGAYKTYRLGEILYHVVEIVAQRMGLVPAGKTRD
jgi:hypothetical protein